LHDEPHSPLQSLVPSQSSAQLVPQFDVVMSHVCSDEHEHAEPEQAVDVLLPPHAITIVMQLARTKRIYGTTEAAANSTAES
jgi:hypothetical protein